VTRRVLVTGATGFVGRHALPALLDRGFEVHAVARRPFDAPGVVAHAVDLLDRRASEAVVAAVRPSHLLHLAWDVTPGRFWWDPANLDWVAASLHLYRAFASAGGRRVTAAGTCAEYDWRTGDCEEDAPTRPATLYGVAKEALHRMLATAAPRDAVSVAWGRIFFLYGPREAPERLVPSVVAPLLRDAPAAVGDGVAIRDFMHVRDVAGALVALLDSDHVGPVNIATGQRHAIRDVVTMIGAQIGRPDLVRLGARPTPPNDPPVLAASGQVLAGLGFRPAFTLQTGLADTIAWWRSAESPRARETP
jgi:nucleoside-diphosphate-sugar epimerase